MLEYLEQLRRKPLHYRKRVAVVATSFITGVILLIWFTTFNFGAGENALDSKSLAEELKPIQQIKESASAVFSTLKQTGYQLFDITGLTASDTPQ